MLRMQTNQMAELRNWGVPNNKRGQGGVEFLVYMPTEQDLITMRRALSKVLSCMEQERTSSGAIKETHEVL